MIRALLIEDEAPAAEDMHRLLRAHPEVRVVGEAGSISAARKLLAVGGYDLVFLDVQLVGGTGFDLVSSVHPDAEIVFVTAYDQHALRAFEVNALDYLLKPVRRERLAASIARALPKPASTAPLPQLKWDDVVHVKTGRSAARFVKLPDIVAVMSEDNYSELILQDGSKLLVRDTLAAWEDRLPPTDFMRVHRQVIVSLRRVEGFEHQDSRTTALQIAGLAEKIPARREYWPEMVARLERLGINVGR
jgi:two-component system LytT family response regulator